jgi:hypothetical protein
VNWIVANIRWIMLVSGALTCTMFYAAIALVLAYGKQSLSHQAGISVVIDLVMVALFVAYLGAVRRKGAIASSPGVR